MNAERVACYRDREVLAEAAIGVYIREGQSEIVGNIDAAIITIGYYEAVNRGDDGRVVHGTDGDQVRGVPAGRLVIRHRPRHRARK